MRNGIPGTDKIHHPSGQNIFGARIFPEKRKPAIVRSEEAKAVGIVMGTPAFLIEDKMRAQCGGIQFQLRAGMQPDLSVIRYRDILNFEMPGESLDYHPVFTIRSPKLRPDGQPKNVPWDWKNLPALSTMNQD